MTSATTRRIAERFPALTAEQRRAVYEKIRDEGLGLADFPILPRPAPAGAPLPLSYAQQRQWFLWSLDRDSTAYHIAGAVALDGTLDVHALREAFLGLVQRHESLRTVFVADADGLARQVVRHDVDVTVPLVDTPDPADLARAVARLVDTPFDLTTGPLLRVGLFRRAPRAHVLVVAMHHIVSDGWSVQVIVDEFVARYRAAVTGAPAALPPLAVQYADYAVWQRHWLEAGEKDRQLAYWTGRLGGPQPVLQLPTDRPRGPGTDDRGANHTMALDDALVARLQQRVQAQGATLFMGLLAGFAVLLHRYTGQTDLRVGVPVANRNRVETEGVVGFFVNTQVLRCDVDGRATLAQVLAGVREAALGAQAHPDLPFEQLVDALQPERSLGHNPLFQVMLSHQRETQDTTLQLPGLTLGRHPLADPAAPFDLTLNTVEDGQGRVQATFNYATALFDATTVARIAAHYRAVLQALADTPGCAVGDVALLDAAEHAQLADWGTHAQRFPDHEPVHRLIEAQARARGAAVAVVFGDETLSHAELNRRANRVAHRLIAAGVRPETRVGIAVERSVEMVVGLLGILKAGAAYVPLDPAYPAERLAGMVADSRIAWVVTQRTVRMPAVAGLQALCLDEVPHDTPAHDPQVPVHGHHLAYVIYTSGSTGTPKGVGIPHHALVEHAQVARQMFGLTAEDRMLQFSTLNFDGFVEQLFPPLICGAGVVLRGPVPWDAETFLHELVARRITVVDLTTAYWFLLVGEFARTRPASYGALRQVHAGGEALPPEGLRLWREAGLEGVTLLNTYGPTEATVTATVLDVQPYVDGTRALPLQMPIGTPLPGRRVHVVDAGLAPVPVGVAGELCIGGALLARGYLGRERVGDEALGAQARAAEGGRLYLSLIHI